jgi:RHS repeat-associated protein
LYYLQSRYYSPELCRFISADDTSILLATQGELIGANLFAYCANNPVMNFDPSGYWVSAIGVSFGVACVVGVSASAEYIFDGYGNSGILISLYLPTFGFSAKGFSPYLGFFWRYKTVRDYKNAVNLSYSLAFHVGVDFVNGIPNYPYDLNGRRVGIRIVGFSFSILYTPNSIKSFYIRLKGMYL